MGVNITKEQLDKLENLREYLKQLQSVAIAFSSGVDSTFLLKAAHDVLGDNAVAFTAKSCSFPKRELDEAIDFCKRENIRHFIFESEELSIEGFSDNPPDRCYICKRELFRKALIQAEKIGISNIAEGSNVDDMGDYRPGLMAVAELGILSPLRKCGLTKADIRALSKYLNLTTWDKQSFACLSSRFVYGETITEDKLKMVDKAEQLLLDMDFHQVRVRIHGMMARIEVDECEIPRLLDTDIRKKIVTELKMYGFTYVSLDLLGYRMGSMNENLEKGEAYGNNIR